MVDNVMHVSPQKASGFVDPSLFRLRTIGQVFYLRNLGIGSLSVVAGDTLANP